MRCEECEKSHMPCSVHDPQAFRRHVYASRRPGITLAAWLNGGREPITCPACVGRVAPHTWDRGCVEVPF